MEEKEKIRKIVRNIIKEQYQDDRNELDVTFYSSWPYEKDYKSQKHTFIIDTKEHLTGYFGTVGLKKEAQIMKKLGQIFDYAMSYKNYDSGINFYTESGNIKPQINTIAGLLEADDVDVVYDIIDGTFNQS